MTQFYAGPKFTLIDQQDDPDQRENETDEIVAKRFRALQGLRQKKTRDGVF